MVHQLLVAVIYHLRLTDQQTYFKRQYSTTGGWHYYHSFTYLWIYEYMTCRMKNWLKAFKNRSSKTDHLAFNLEEAAYFF